MSTYLVTGGAGFIGSHLVEALLAQGDKVRVLDDLSTGKRENLPSHCPLIVGCVTDPATIEHALQGVDGCFHLAAISSVQASVAAMAATHRVNLTATVELIERAARRGLPLIYASSAAAYGDCPDVPLTEAAACRPLTPYGLDKWTCEQQARVAALNLGLTSVGLRFFNVYGPRQDPRSPYSGVISIFLDRILSAASITFYGDGGQTRDFLHVSDAVRFLVAAMARARTRQGAEVFNACTGTQTSIGQLAALIEALSGRSVDHERRPARAGDIRISCGSPDKALDSLGISARVALKEGLRTMLAAPR